MIQRKLTVWILFTLAIGAGCTKAQVSTPRSEEFWTGHQHDYCRITVDRIYQMGLPWNTPFSPPVPESSVIEEAKALHQRHFIQEAIWQLEDFGSLDTQALAQVYKNELRTALESDLVREDSSRNLGGLSDKKFLEFENGLSAVFKYTNGAPHILNTSYPMEWAAYEMDQLLKTNLVPMTVLRKFENNEGSAQLFISGLSSGGQNVVQFKNFAPLRVFDFIIGNTDRKADNLLWSKKLNRIVGIDHGMTFQAEALDHNPDHTCGSAQEAGEFLQHLPSLKGTVKELTRVDLERAISEHIDKESIDLVWARIEALQQSL